MSDKNNNAGGGFGLGTVLFLIFLVLKLCNVIDWSWWWVTSPLWISAIIVVLLFVGIFIYYYIEDRKLEPKNKKRGKKNEKD
jgi:tellurite resistance protein TehA-like permease